MQTLASFYSCKQFISLLFLSAFPGRNVNLKILRRGEERDFPSIISLFLAHTHPPLYRLRLFLSHPYMPSVQPSFYSPLHTLSVLIFVLKAFVFAFWAGSSSFK